MRCIRTALVLPALIFTMSYSSYAQSIFCPPNLDFEMGGLGFWEFDTGSCCPINVSLSSPLFNRHTLTFGNTTDPYGGFPVVAPGGGQFSLRLGNSGTNKQAERATYYIQVPPAPGKYVFVYRYAVVFQDPKHDPGDQPRFEVMAFDSATKDVLACNKRTYVAKGNIPGFIKSTVDTSVYFKEWTSATLNLSAYNGKTVGISFSSGDCALGGHFGYGYVDMNCGLFKVYTTQCNNSSDAVLVGPPGYQGYKWMDGNFLSILGTAQTIKLPLPLSFTSYAVIVTPYPGYGCVDTFYTEFNILNDNLIVVAPDVAYCAGGYAQLVAGTINAYTPFTFKWWPAAGLSCTTCISPKTSPTVPTTYYVSIQNQLGCIDTEDVVVTMNPRPVADAGPDTMACYGEQVTLVGNGGGTYKWTPSSNLDNPSVSAPKATVKTKFIYHLIVTNSDGCNDTDEVTVTPYPQPDVDAGIDTSVCTNAVVRLNGQGDGDIFKWFPPTGLSNPDTSAPLDTITHDIDYYLYVTNEYGCTATDTLSITAFEPPPFAAGYDTTICSGDTVSLFASGGQLYFWQEREAVSDQQNAAPLAWPGASTIYHVHITDTVCSRQDTLEVKVAMFPLNQLRVVATPITCGGELVGQLTAYGGENYTWSPPDGLENIHGKATKARPSTSTLYTLTGINDYGCMDTASALLEVSGDNSIFTPNAFTPNADGVNDCYRLIIVGIINSFELHIYNRWGQEVFTTTNYNDCWDGTFRGTKLDLGTYYYFYKATSPLCGNMLGKGNIQLVR